MRTGFSLLDFRLGIRMLVKYPGLTLVGGLGMAVAIAIGAGAYAYFNSYLHPTLPLHEGGRVVGLENWDAAAGNQEPRSLHDFATWRDELRSVEDVGAFRTVERNLVAPDGTAEPVPVAEMTASGFRVARVPALVGRPLLDEDEREGAPPVLVIGHEEWRTRFAADPGVVGRSVRLGGVAHTVVGVMPEGFAFPVSHRFWTPLRADPSKYERRRGPAVTVFGRLAPGATLEAARAELDALGRRTAAANPKTH
ncbi:MAG TPA: ABC transporter permease, partial [Longimicrobium sp.]|nr:ABC transporter permease [Longimicrobium sp.]